VTLWESRPVLKKVVAEEGDEPPAQAFLVELDESEMPVTETVSRGVMRLNMINWLKRSP
jgi:hypothetical protein